MELNFNMNIFCRAFNSKVIDHDSIQSQKYCEAIEAIKIRGIFPSLIFFVTIEGFPNIAVSTKNLRKFGFITFQRSRKTSKLFLMSAITFVINRATTQL